MPKEDEFQHILEQTNVRKKGKSSTYELNIIRKDGSLGIISVNATPIFDRGKKYKGSYGTFTDITDRKRAEETLRETKEYAQNIIESSLDMIVAVDKNRFIVEFNKAAQETFGYSKKEILGKHVNILYANEKEGKRISEIVGDKGKFIGEITNIRKNGEIFPTFLSASVIHDSNGEIIGVVGNSRDITERKQAEQKIKESEEKYKTLYETTYDAIFVADSVNENIYSQMFRYSPFPILIHDMEMNIIDANIKAVEEFDYPKEELLKKKVTDLHNVTELEHSSQVLENIQKVNRMTVETSFMRKDGSVFNAEATPSKYKLGEKLLIHVLIQDITERKQAEEELLKHRENLEDLVSERTAELKNAMIKLQEEITERKRAEELLKKSEEKIRLFMESATDGFILLDPELNFIEINSTGLESIGKIREEIIGKNILEINPSLKGTERYDKYLEVIKTGKPFFMDDFIHHSTLGDMHLNVRVFKAGSGLGIIFTDITERKQMEKALQVKAVEMDSLINNLPDMAWLKDINSNFIIANKAFGNAVGMNPEYLVNHTCAVCFGEEMAKKFKEDDKKVMKAKNQIIIEESITDAKGNKISLETVKSPIFNESNEVIGTVGIARDITKHKKAEEKLKQLANEKEILLKEAHHRIKNNFALLSSLLNLQIPSIKCPEDKVIIKECQERILLLSGLHESLYQSEAVGEVNMQSYLTKIINDLCISYNIEKDRISVNTNIEKLYIKSKDATACGIIFNELFTNAIKYGFPIDVDEPEGKKGEIKVSFTLRPDSKIEMIVFNNGVPFPEEIDFRKTDTLGMQLVMMLVQGLDGTIDLDRGGGTKFRVVF